MQRSQVRSSPLQCTDASIGGFVPDKQHNTRSDMGAVYNSRPPALLGRMR